MKLVVEDSKGIVDVGVTSVERNKISDLLLDLRVLIKNYIDNE